MKKFIFPYIAAVMSLLYLPAYSQEDSTALLGLAGDNLDLYAVLTLFQKSKTIEAFEKSLNDEKEKINNLDLNLDKKVDFIKVVTKKKDDSYSFILQVDVNKKETQDVAVILLDRDKDKKISLQIVGDEALYGKDYVIEPKGNSPVTPNPAYTGENPVTVTVPATTTVVVQSAPIVQYVYSPAYVPYTPPYYYGFYPPWFGFATVMAVGIYRHNHYHYHGGYYGGHYGGGNTVIVNRNNYNNFNNYQNNKMRSTTVANNRANGSYGDRAADRSGNRGSTANRPSTGTSNRPSAGTSNRPSAGTSNRPSAGTANRPSTGVSNRPSTGVSNNRATTRPSTSNYSSGRTRSGGGGGGMRSGGGGGRRR
ncbi:hypothetical protein [Paraflavitalea sp. CAU 1676]|uniref:hypothetical protein n=1 Tax=Paraflavitalea sp. CAU 1676 TaxID=3032598 RepID=UPI0023DBCB3B|nr:hypothetical protein [Paraflavitalea sp. CAU 1676]MDF2193347.1 hypothetical protein [Paraflavitalea sp. CAU 1676]